MKNLFRDGSASAKRVVVIVAGIGGLTAAAISFYHYGGSYLKRNDLRTKKLKASYTERVLAAAEAAIPGLRQTARLILPGTPVTFQRFTRRSRGWVGGLPQTNLTVNFGPRLATDLWMVGDSIFPGQSTAAVALGGLRVAELINKEGKLR